MRTRATYLPVLLMLLVAATIPSAAHCDWFATAQQSPHPQCTAGPISPGTMSRFDATEKPWEADCSKFPGAEWKIECSDTDCHRTVCEPDPVFQDEQDGPSFGADWKIYKRVNGERTAGPYYGGVDVLESTEFCAVDYPGIQSGDTFEIACTKISNAGTLKAVDAEVTVAYSMTFSAINVP